MYLVNWVTKIKPSAMQITKQGNVFSKDLYLRTKTRNKFQLKIIQKKHKSQVI